ncbi:MAG: gliding motility-associated C-terminal domain-containing protein [Flavobacteriales bacterium]|nr:gliding motility-associated C-terminal domain-containing protein [Flavobacteriales bacterium]
MKFLIKTLIITAAFTFFQEANSQTYTIDQGGSVNTCAGDFFDSNNSGNYQDNENYTFTICSDGSAGSNIVNLGFATLFDIDPSDTLFVYDGNSTAATLIGAFNNNNIPTGGVASTTSNTSGCLTFQFISDGAVNSQGWNALIGCLRICQPINPIIITTPTLVNFGPDSTYTNICPGDTVLFNALGTYPNDGVNPLNYTQSDATSTFEWALGTGNVLTTQSASEIYNTPQGYLILLTITDVNGCIETIKHRVRTGIPPIFSGVLALPDTACFGDTVNLIGGFTQTLTPTATGVATNTGIITAGGIVSGQTFLPDGSGTSYTTSVNISGFSGQTIVNGTDIAEVCMNIEHSYIGDLTIELTCPNNTTIILSDTYSSSSPGGTFLGDANDDGSTVPGIGMDYCFDLGAAWGTMTVENNNNNWIPSTVSPGSNILTPGNFQPEQSFNGLVGCPIDGNWTLTITDNIGADNGYIFEWGITLNPAINPNAEFYTVNLLNGTWLSNPDIINDYDTLAIATPSVAGVNSFIFEVTDEYGCTFDTTIQVVVLPELNPIASPDTIVCFNQLVTLDVNTVDSCSYSLELFDSYGDGWNGASLTLFINGIPFLTNITVPNCSGNTSTGCTNIFNIPVTTGDIITMNYTSGSFNSEHSVTLYDPSGAQIFTINNAPDGAIGGNIIAICGDLLDYLWSPAAGLNNPTIKNPIFDGLATNSYTVTISHSNFPQCSTTSDSITLVVVNDPIPVFSVNDTLICIGESITLSLTIGDTILWSTGDTTLSINLTPTGDTTISVVVDVFCGSYSFSQNIVVINNPLPLLTGDSLICIGESVALTISNSSSILWPAGDTTAIVNFIPIRDTTITVTASNFCDTINFTKFIEVTNNTAPDILGDSVVCFGDLVSLTGTATDVELYLWPDSSTASSVSFIPNTDTLVTLYASNRCDTSITNIFIIVNPNPITTISPDTSITIQDSTQIFVLGGNTGVNYTWDPNGSLNCSNCASPIAFPTETTTYSVEIIDTNGCINSNTITIEVLIPDLFIPTGFSPNNDGVNDMLFVRSLDIEKMILQIYNRWGGLVFETEDQEIGWDGKYNGHELDFGVYVYRFEATFLSGEKITQSGSITLFK